MLETFAAFVFVGALLLLAATVALVVAFFKVLGALVLWPISAFGGGALEVLAAFVLGAIGLLLLVALAPLVLGFVLSVILPLAVLGGVLAIVARARTVPAPARPVPLAIPVQSTVHPV